MHWSLVFVSRKTILDPFVDFLLLPNLCCKRKIGLFWITVLQSVSKPKVVAVTALWKWKCVSLFSYVRHTSSPKMFFQFDAIKTCIPRGVFLNCSIEVGKIECALSCGNHAGICVYVYCWRVERRKINDIDNIDLIESNAGQFGGHVNQPSVQIHGIDQGCNFPSFSTFLPSIGTKLRSSRRISNTKLCVHWWLWWRKIISEFVLQSNSNFSNLFLLFSRTFR